MTKRLIAKSAEHCIAEWTEAATATYPSSPGKTPEGDQAACPLRDEGGPRRTNQPHAHVFDEKYIPPAVENELRQNSQAGRPGVLLSKKSRLHVQMASCKAGSGSG